MLRCLSIRIGSSWSKPFQAIPHFNGSSNSLIVLANARGTAPGLAFVGNPIASGARTRILLMLPGPPRELRPMFQTDALPLIQKSFPAAEPFVCRTLKTSGLGESYLEERIVPAVKHLLPSGLELGYCARTGEVDLRLVAKGGDAARLVAGDLLDRVKQRGAV